MLPLAQLIAERCSAGERIALCTLVKARGSTPQETGAKMAVTSDGTLHGTLGGGCVEAEVRRRAMELLHLRRSELLTYRLDSDYGWDDGLICGGTMLIYVQILEGPTDAARYAEIAEDVAGSPRQSSFDSTIKPTKARKLIPRASNRARLSSSLAAVTSGRLSHGSGTNSTSTSP